MTEQAFDALLRKALMEAVMEDLGPVWDGELPADPQSPRQRRRMLRLLRDPFRVVRRRARPAWKRGLRAAVCAVIISAALFVATVAAVPQARAWVKELWSQWFETNTRYGFSGEVGRSNIIWRPTYMPDGYTEMYADDCENDGQVQFISLTGQIIYFGYTPIQDGTSFNIDNVHADYSQIYLKDGRIADLYISNVDGKASYILWTDSDSSTAFRIMADLPSKELITIAESVSIL